MGWKSWLVPQEKKFFDMLESEAANLLKGAKTLSVLINNGMKTETVKDIEDIEHRGDNIVHEICEELNKTFITPIDHEDISKLASALDDVLDHIHAASRRFNLYNIKKPTKVMIAFSDILLEACKDLEIAVSGIRNLKDPEGIEKKCVEVNTLENKADEILNSSVAELLKGKDAIKIIKLKEIYEFLESAMDRCEDAADVISDIVVKHR
jgi:hypothetical protein